MYNIFAAFSASLVSLASVVQTDEDKVSEAIKGQEKRKRGDTARRDGKENISSKPIPVNDDSDDDDVTVEPINNSLNITPPGSPNSSAGRLSSGKRPRSVRGANRTRKTEQALKRILVSEQEKEQLEQQRRPKRRRKTATAAAHRHQHEDEEEEDEKSLCRSPVTSSLDTTSVASFPLKVRFRGEIHRVAVTQTDRLGQVADRFGAALDLQPGRISFEMSGERLGRDAIVLSTGVSIVSILQARWVDTAF